MFDDVGPLSSLNFQQLQQGLSGGSKMLFKVVADLPKGMDLMTYCLGLGPIRTAVLLHDVAGSEV